MEKPLVLLADDNEATCTLITALLHRDFAVEIANDGQEALEKLKSRQYAAILLDLLMPGVDGYAVLDHLRRETPALLGRVIVVTASLSPRELDRVRAYPIHGLLPKPFDVETLQIAVRECAGPGGESSFRGPLLAGGMLLMLAADLLRKF
ncbi:MAG TPA: response regulator [Thermoanaerobaculia bacterium]|nr:response regulator [Thermoanaerobaculia bacterium]